MPTPNGHGLGPSAPSHQPDIIKLNHEYGHRLILSHFLFTAGVFLSTYFISYYGFQTAVETNEPSFDGNKWLHVPSRQVNVTDFHLSTSLDYGIVSKSRAKAPSRRRSRSRRRSNAGGAGFWHASGASMLSLSPVVCRSQYLLTISLTTPLATPLNPPPPPPGPLRRISLPPSDWRLFRARRALALLLRARASPQQEDNLHHLPPQA